jgi:hypothetical protein
MNNDNKEFYDLLNSIVDEQTFPLQLSPKEDGTSETVSCKALSTAQLKELIKTVVDSPLTQASFNSTATRIFKQSILDSSELSLNTIDRLLFIIGTRIQSLSPTMSIKDGDKTIFINFNEINDKLKQKLEENSSLLKLSTATEGQITVKFGVALLDTEAQLNSELYKNLNLNVEDADELRKVIGEAFINEIAKAVQTITIGDKTLDFSAVTFKSRLKTIESLPASLIQKVIEYIENYKKIIDECLTVDGHTIPIDGSLFSLR